jgi:hypothetical protein
METNEQNIPAEESRVLETGPVDHQHNHRPENSPGLIVLQWLTYAFWGWTVLSLSALISMVISSAIQKSDTSDFAPYAIAAVFVLLPISFICDVFYSKKEPTKKIGAQVIVMVLHAVLFALIGIGALILAVFSMVEMFTNGSDSSGTQVSLYTSLIIAVVYGSLFLRTLSPPNLPWVRKYFKYSMVLLAGVSIVLAIIGPAANARLRRNDKLIENNISSVEQSIEGYASSNQKLPDSLGILSLDSDAKKLVDENLIQYTPNTKSPTSAQRTSGVQINTYSPKFSNTNAYPPVNTYYYTLCANYKRATSNNYGSYINNQSDYMTYISSTNHPAGKVCYQLKTTDYGY